MTNPVLDVVQRDLMTPEAREGWRRRRIALFKEHFEPPVVLRLSDWGEKFYRLSRESSGEPGPLSLERTPYLRGVMDTLTDPLVERTVFQKPKRIGGTVTANVWIAHTMVEDPGPVIGVFPTEKMAKSYSKQQFKPMLRDVPALRGKVKDSRARDSDNTILEKSFPGGSIAIGGSNSPDLFRMRTARDVWATDVDDPNFVRNPEGDTIDLATGRTETMPGARSYIESSPGLAIASRIVPLYLEGDQRELYVPCPHCGLFQTLIWGNLRYKEVTEPVYICGTAETSSQPARGCGHPIPEQLKYRMLLAHEWRASAPFNGIASFRMNALYSPFPGATWPKLISSWHKAQLDVRKLQTFVNTVLGEPWEEKGGRIASGGLRDRKRKFGAPVPGPVRILTMAVDIQHDRLEYKVKGYGPGVSSCVVEVGAISGSPVHKQVWAELDQVRARRYAKRDGTQMAIAGTGIDTGDGTFQKEAYEYIAQRGGFRLFALKGSSNASAPPLPRRPSRNNKWGVPLWVIGVSALKSTLFGRLKIQTPGPGYMWFPDWLDDEYFKQLASESPRPKDGRIEWYLRPGDRNEKWDLEVYCLAVLMRLGQENFLQSLPWEDWNFDPPADPLPSESARPEGPEPPAPKKSPRRRRGGYLRDWQ